jgi:rod shape-determining protein MreD
MKRAGLVALIVAGVLLQMSLLPALRPFGVVPNLVLVLVVLIGLEGVSSRALIAGVGAGFILDLVSGSNFGLWTGCLVLAALVTGLLHRSGIEPGAGITSVMVAAGTAVMAVVIVVGLWPTTADVPIGLLAGRLLMEIVLNLGLAMALRPAVRWLTGGV